MFDIVGKIFPLILVFFIHVDSAAQKLSANDGKVIFEASVRSFEPVTAKNEKAYCVLNTSTGSVSASVTITEFDFRLDMMREHFNQNYLESDRYPKATFKGTLEQFNLSALTDRPVVKMLKGKLRIRGKSREVLAPAMLRKTSNGVELIIDLEVNTDDYKIGIPALVRNKVSKNVRIHGEFNLR